jgi:hypothetical protein
MNKLPPMIQTAIKSIPKRDWEMFFESYKQTIRLRLDGSPDEDLPKLKAEVGAIATLQTKFLEIFSQ